MRNCLDKAGKNIKKQDICLDKYEYDSYAIAPITECNAYKASIKCLEERKSADSCVTKKGRIQWKKQMSLEKCYKNCFCKKQIRSIKFKSNVATAHPIAVELRGYSY